MKTASLYMIFAAVGFQGVTEAPAQVGALREPIAVVKTGGKMAFINRVGSYVFGRQFGECPGLR